MERDSKSRFIYGGKHLRSRTHSHATKSSTCFALGKTLFSFPPCVGERPKLIVVAAECEKKSAMACGVVWCAALFGSINNEGID